MADNYEQRHGLFCKSLGEISFENVRIRTAAGPAMTFEEADRVTVEGLRVAAGQDPLAIAADGVGELLLGDCDIDSGIDPVLDVRDAGVDELSVSANFGDLEGRIG